MYKKRLCLFILTMFFLNLILNPFVFSTDNARSQDNFDFELDYDFLNEIVDNLSDIVNKSNPKGRFYGTIGEHEASEYLKNKWQEKISSDIKLERITNNIAFQQVNNYNLNIFFNENYVSDEQLNKNSQIEEINWKKISPSKTEYIPFPSNLKSEINYSFNASIQVIKNSWVTNHSSEIPILHYYEPSDYIMKSSGGKVSFLDKFNQEKEYKILIIKNESRNITNEVNKAIEKGANGFIFVSSDNGFPVDVKYKIPGVVISKWDEQNLQSILDNYEKVYINIPEKDIIENEETIFLSYGDENEYNETFGEITSEEKIFLVENINFNALKILNLRYQEQMKEYGYSNIQGYIISDKNDYTHYMIPTNYSLPGMSINGSFENNIKELINEEKNVKANFLLNQSYNRSIDSYNVIGTIDGKIDDVIIIEGHYDSWWGEFSIDNAVSPAVAWTIAKYYKEHDIQPNYTLKFIAFCGEEVGLKGSKNYVEKHRDEFDDISIKALINLDTFALKLPENVDIPFKISYYPLNFKLKKEVMDILNKLDYEERTGYQSRVIYDFKIGPIGGLRYRSDAKHFIEHSDNILLIDKFEPFLLYKNDFYYQRTGNNHTVGDCLELLDRNDLNVSSEVILNLINYFDQVPDKYDIFYKEDYEGVNLPLVIVVIISSIVLTFAISYYIFKRK